MIMRFYYPVYPIGFSAIYPMCFTAAYHRGAKAAYALLVAGPDYTSITGLLPSPIFREAPWYVRM